jgi:small-conductance mechanosensitive channel
VIAAVLIFLVAGAVSTAVVALANRTMGDTPTGKFVTTAAPILIMAIATFMILTELGIAEQIVLITYAALIGAVALGMALAFGLGGRDVAARMLESAYQAGREGKEQVKRDVGRGDGVQTGLTTPAR